MLNRKEELKIEGTEMANDEYSWADAKKGRVSWSEEVFPPRKRETWNTVSHCERCHGCPYHKVIEKVKETEWEIEYILISSCAGTFDSDPATGRTWCIERQIVMPTPTLRH